MIVYIGHDNEIELNHYTEVQVKELMPRRTPHFIPEGTPIQLCQKDMIIEILCCRNSHSIIIEKKYADRDIMLEYIKFLLHKEAENKRELVYTINQFKEDYFKYFDLLKYMVNNGSSS